LARDKPVAESAARFGGGKGEWQALCCGAASFRRQI